MAFIEGRLKLEWPVQSCLAANRAWACAQNIQRHTGWHTYGQRLTLPQVSVYCTEKWVGKGSSELSGCGPLLRGPLALSSVARLFDALGKAPDVPGICERGLLRVAFCFCGVAPTCTLCRGWGVKTHSTCCTAAHSFSSSPQICFSSSTTKTATSRAYSTRPTPGAEQGPQTLPVPTPAPWAACPHLLPR